MRASDAGETPAHDPAEREAAVIEWEREEFGAELLAYLDALPYYPEPHDAWMYPP